MTNDLRDVLNEALDDEYKAMATYRAVLARFGDVRPFSRIVEAEARHAAALLRQFERLGLDPIPDRWDGRVEAPASLDDACAAGVEAEIENAEMYDRLLARTEDPEVRAVLHNLRRASQENHLPAFRRCLERGHDGGGHGGGHRGHGGRRRRHRGGRRCEG